MIFMQQIQYNAPNHMSLFQKIFEVTPGPLLVLSPRTGHLASKILTARMLYTTPETKKQIKQIRQMNTNERLYFKS